MRKSQKRLGVVSLDFTSRFNTCKNKTIQWIIQLLACRFVLSSSSSPPLVESSSRQSREPSTKPKCSTTKYDQNYSTGQTVFYWYLFKIFLDFINWRRFYAFTNYSCIGVDDKFVYTPSLQNYPDLPPWIHYKFNNKNRYGYLYGTPPVILSEQQVLVKKKNIYFHWNTYILFKTN